MKIFHRGFEMPEKEQVAKEDDKKDRDEASNPLHIHKLVAGKFFHVGDGDKVRRAADGRTKASDAAAPADGEQYGNG